MPKTQPFNIDDMELTLPKSTEAKWVYYAERITKAYDKPDFIGIFSTREKATDACKKHAKNRDYAVTGPIIWRPMGDSIQGVQSVYPDDTYRVMPIEVDVAVKH